MVNDLMWSLALPEGVIAITSTLTRYMDHGEARLIERLPRCLIRGYGGDPLVDKQKGLMKMLEARGVHVLSKFEERGFHAVRWLVQERPRICMILNEVNSVIYENYNYINGD